MSIAVISYSLTGNNQALAESIARKLSAAHIKIKEPRNRTIGTIIADLIFGRTPKTQPAPSQIGEYDRLLFVGPVWIGQVATPLRAYLHKLKKEPCRYAFISISGGADGPNTKLADELKKAAGIKPEVLIDLHITDFLPTNPKPSRDETSAYKLSGENIEKLTQTVMKTLGTLVL